MGGMQCLPMECILMQQRSSDSATTACGLHDARFHCVLGCKAWSFQVQKVSNTVNWESRTCQPHAQARDRLQRLCRCHFQAATWICQVNELASE